MPSFSNPASLLGQFATERFILMYDNATTGGFVNGIYAKGEPVKREVKGYAYTESNDKKVQEFDTNTERMVTFVFLGATNTVSYVLWKGEKYQIEDSYAQYGYTKLYGRRKLEKVYLQNTNILQP